MINYYSRKKLLILLSILFLTLGTIFIIHWYLRTQFEESTDDAYVNGNTVQVMSQIAGQVTEILHDVTDFVTKGDKVVMIDQADAEIALKLQEAELGLIVRQVNQSFINVEKQKANVLVAKDNYEKAKEDFERRQGLIINKTISQEDFRHTKITLEAAKASLEYAEKQLSGAMAFVGNTDLFHHPQVQQAIANYRKSYLNWRRTIIYAPETGFVAKRSVQVGQQISPNTVLMIIVPLNQVWVDANFKESQLKNIRINQPVTLTSDAYGSVVKYHGRVVGLSPGTGSAFDLLPPQNATGNWIKIIQRLPVRILIDSKELQDHPLRIGLSMDVTISTRHREGEQLTKATSMKILFESQSYNSDLDASDKIIQKILQKNLSNVQVPIKPN